MGVGSIGAHKGWKIVGLKKVEANINKELMKIKMKSAAGMVMAAAMVIKDADKTPPLVPVGETGDLRSNTSITPLKKPVSGDPYVVFGYNQNYAAAVHEMMESPLGKDINWSRPQSGPKFFQASLRRNKAEILRIIKEANV